MFSGVRNGEYWKKGKGRMAHGLDRGTAQYVMSFECDVNFGLT